MSMAIISLTAEFAAIIALISTIRKRKKIEFSIFLFLMAFEVIVILAAGWAFVIYGAVFEMNKL